MNFYNTVVNQISKTFLENVLTSLRLELSTTKSLDSDRFITQDLISVPTLPS